MKNYPLKITLALSLFVFAASASASPFAPDDYHYVFGFSYRAGKLLANDPAYEIMTGPRSPVEAGSYTLTVKNRAGQVLTSLTFDPSASTVDVPYQPSGVQAVVTGSNGSLVLRVDLVLSSTCNDNRICQADIGEDSYNCSTDCPGGALASTLAPSPDLVTSYAQATIAPVETLPPNTAPRARWKFLLLGLLAGTAAVFVGHVLQRYRHPL